MSDEEDYMSDALLLSCGDVRPGLYKGSKEAHKRNQESIKLENRKQKQKPLRLIEAEKRNEGLTKSLDSTNKGFALLQKMGYKPGEGIGKTGEGRLEPVSIELKVNRGGLGQEVEKRKRKKQLQGLREQQHAKKMKYAQQMQDKFREVKISEQKQRRLEKSLKQSQRVCEQLDHGKNIEVPLRSYYWPEDLLPASSSKYDDVTAEVDDVTAEVDDVTAGGDDVTTEVDYVTARIDDVTPGIDDVTAQVDDVTELTSGDVKIPNESNIDEICDETPGICEQLVEVTDYLRTTYLYCVWCGYAFDDAESLSSDCPGNTEEEHHDL